MSNKRHSNFLNEKVIFSPGKSITSSTKKDSLFFRSFIAISPDSQQIVIFSPETHEFKLYNLDDLSSSIFTHEYKVNDKRLCWSIAISNCVDDDKNERLIALSCFDERELRHDITYDDDEGDLESGNKVVDQRSNVKSDLESGDKVNNQYGDDENDLESGAEQYGDDKRDIKSGDKYLRLRPQTWVISTKEKREIYTSSIGGVIRFLDSDDSLLKNKTVIIIVNVSGIYKETMNNIKKKQRFFSRSSKIEQFELPKQLLIRLSRDHWHISLELLHTSIIKNHFMVHSFKNRQQIIEMYSLITGDLEMLFKRHESSVAPNIIHGSPAFAISQNEKILAFCRGTTSITLYFMENGLEIATKQLESQRIYKIMAINFIDDDSKLLIVLEEKEDRQREFSKNHQIFVVWDLFTTFKNSIRQIDYSETRPLAMGVTNRLMNSHGKVFAVRDGGDIFSVLDHPDVASIRNPSDKAMTKIDITTRDHVYHAIYSINGERFDASKLEENRIIIANVEPWHLDKNYFRMSVYLDSTESTQLIISSNTIQVWKYRNNNTIEKRDERVLEYIWARNKEIDVKELRIIEREFVLKASTKGPTPKTMTIHWPNNVNILEGACRALYVLGEKEHIVTGHENVNKIKYLVECTQRLVRKYITKYGIFRLTSIRYPIMKYLIASQQESLIKLILNKKINKKNCNIYIPRLYEWADEDNNRSTTEISKSDLYHAILCILKRGDSTIILKYLIDYYADNAKEYNNHGWMFTISKAIPSLYDFDLIECTQRLVRKYITKYGIFRLTSIRYPIMKYLIASQQESLIKLILNKKINKKNCNIYIPRLYEWADEDNNRSTTEISKSDLYHAILCILKRGDSTIILKYLIDYYADNAKEYNNHGWMFTISKAIPSLYDFDLSEFVQYLFRKPCFGITEAYTPPLHINPYDQKKGNNAVVVHSLVVKPRLASKFHNTLWFFLKNLFTRIKTSHNDRKVCIVPLPDFTVYPDPKHLEDREDLEDNSENYSNYFWLLFTFFRISLWPRRKDIDNNRKMSPFLRVIHEEEGDEIYQTPAIMAVLDFKWSAARRYFIRHIVMYMFYAISYTITVVSYSFNGDSKMINFFKMDSRSVLLPLAISVQSILYDHEKISLHFSVFNPVLAFTALVMWLEVLLLLRYFEGPGRFIYIIKNILNTIWPFFAFMLIAVLAFGHAMFILLNYVDDSSLRIATYKIKDTSNPDLYSNITIYQDVDKSDRLDNYYSQFVSSVEAVFFWTNGRWDQLDQWDIYAVDVMSILGSIILVLIFQNMLIAFMNGAFDKANKEGRTAAHRYRAELIAEYEALEKPRDSKRGNPRYIYYISDPDMIDTWLTEVEKQKLRLMGENLAELTDSDYSDDDCDDSEDYHDDGDDDDDDNDNSFYSKKYRHIKNEGPSSTIDLDSIEPSTTKYNDVIDKISFIDEENFPLKVTSKLNKKSQRNWKSNNKLLKNVSYNELLSEDPGPTTNVYDQLSMQERFNNLENEFKTRFNNQEARFDKLEQNLKAILKTLNNLNNPK
ncbi:hypothetical protein Glove_503g23 [Diversispora epigaea]|uniref:Ion transport domain-containing protein n=1 Tax=Diversispora epigaea TaxID=1348612 RepID=A0A397GJ75_9GLOM|nr:hypothetical protein Glove_503g23 [Diversispora epigaea]